MRRVFRGAIPKDHAFFHNLLFSLVSCDGHGLKDFIGGRYDKDGQKFKVTIVIERDKSK